MKKVILLLIIILTSALLVAQSITIHSMGIKKDAGNPVGIEEGATISVYVTYTTVDMNNLLAPHADNDIDKIWIDKFTGLIPSVGNYDSSIKVSITGFQYQGIGTNKYCYFDFVCPNIDGIKSIQVRFGLYGDGGGL